MTMVKGYLFRVECWEKYPSGHHLLGFLGKGKLEKVMAKALERKKSIFGVYL